MSNALHAMLNGCRVQASNPNRELLRSDICPSMVFKQDF